ncbi:phospholipase D-like domain-containing protein [Pseudomonas sp. TTU2014-080ASC]|uniref:phospholipase D-like domain-containing protein n=1 Tax=Pseudomonas sp. TTU2014-080ASC TaxID=1729724 RepID=UPI0007185500|nr:phosphatidylserine/phosphatidylglycerophosphate/cardiolipin synthase family protein [Pseudomonas sp. TTU2014-080ASC]KRW62678.1 phospholipase [Pseudomonas sp. TTU2014-080ASC]
MAQDVFPWRPENSLSLLIDGPQFFPRMLETIAQAQAQIDLELYLVESGACTDTLLEALSAAVGRGVQVRCLFDAFGCQGLNALDRSRMDAAGITVRWYNPLRWKDGRLNFHRDHRKLLVVDRQIAFVGGTGSTDEFWEPAEALSDWHEVMVEVSGPLVQDWQALFDRQWHDYQLIQSLQALRPKMPMRLKNLPTLPLARTGYGRVAYADGSQHRDILLSLVLALKNARTRVWLATPYFLPTLRVRRSLRKAAERGVDVCLLLTGQHTDHPPVRFAGQRYYPKLLKAGVRIFEYQPRFLHLKMVLVDDWVSVGSCNFDHWNLRFNLDANLEALDAEFTARVAESFQRDFADSKEITKALWKARPWWLRLRQSIWGALDQWLVNLLDRRR